MSKKTEAIALANHLGYDIIQMNDKTGYMARKKTVWGIIDRRNGFLLATYSTWKDILNCLQKQMK
jgi:hypothetical protein